MDARAKGFLADFLQWLGHHDLFNTLYAPEGTVANLFYANRRNGVGLALLSVRVNNQFLFVSREHHAIVAAESGVTGSDIDGFELLGTREAAVALCGRKLRERLRQINRLQVLALLESVGAHARHAVGNVERIVSLVDRIGDEPLIASVFFVEHSVCRIVFGIAAVNDDFLQSKAEAEHTIVDGLHRCGNRHTRYFTSVERTCLHGIHRVRDSHGGGIGNITVVGYASDGPFDIHTVLDRSGDVQHTGIVRACEGHLVV